VRLAIFDIDGTLIRPSTGWLITQALRDEGILGRRDLVRGAYFQTLLRLGVLNYERVVKTAMKVLKGRSEEEVRGWFDKAFEDKGRHRFVQTAVDLLHQHRERGDRIALISGTSRIIGELICTYMPVDDLICADAEIVDGRITDQIILPVPYKEGKIPHAERLSRETGLSLENAIFYTDSIADLPLMERVGEPVAMNPDLRMGWVAKKRGWRIIADTRSCTLARTQKKAG
jgi:HAD superfamily hydrolase (TIGR01490 family)